MGVVGLGVGTLAAYVYLPGIRFVSTKSIPRSFAWPKTISPIWPTPAARGATVEIVLGDARLSLERELKQAPQAFDLLVLDAFSGDSIPIHLLTKEAFDIYLPHLAPEGALAVHISNRHLDLAPVVYGLAEHFELDAVRIFATTCNMPAGWPNGSFSRGTQNCSKSLRSIEGISTTRTAARRRCRYGPTSGTICWRF